MKFTPIISLGLEFAMMYSFSEIDIGMATINSKPRNQLLCESEKREHLDLTLGFSFAKHWSICSCIYFIAIFAKLFCKTKCKFS